MTPEQMDLSPIWDKVSMLPWCVLVSTGRAGSDALQSQLDSHSQIIGITGILYFHTWWASSRVANHPGPIHIGDLVDEFIWGNIKLFKSRYDWGERKGELGPDRDQEVPMDVSKFRDFAVGLLEGRELTPRNTLIAIFTANAMALGQDMDDKRAFFYHVHHVRKLPDFLADFPDSKIIAMTRDPRAAYFSGVLNWRKSEPVTDSPAYPLYVLWRIVDEAQPLVSYGDRARVMRLEDLDKPAVLTALCHWLGVAYEPCVMYSTWGGLRWWGDRLSSAKTDKNMSEEEFVKAIRSNGWEQKMSTVDKFVLRVVLNPQLRRYGYCSDQKPAVWEFIVALPALFLVTGFEARYWRPAYVLTALRQRRIKDVVRIFYHYLRRVPYFVRLYVRSVRGFYHPLEIFRADPSTNPSETTS